MKYPKNLENDYFASIAKQPDKKFYFNIDLIHANDGEMMQKDLYPYQVIGEEIWRSSSFNGIKFEMPGVPPLYNWNSIDKAIHKNNFLFSLFVIKCEY